MADDIVPTEELFSKNNYYRIEMAVIHIYVDAGTQVIIARKKIDFSDFPELYKWTKDHDVSFEVL